MEKVSPELRATERTSMKDLWDKRTKFAMVSLEEVVFVEWQNERTVLVGDSAHKVYLSLLENFKHSRSPLIAFLGHS